MLTCKTADLAEVYGCSVAYIGRLIKEGILPKAIAIGQHDAIKACKAIVVHIKGDGGEKEDSDLKAEQLRYTKAKARRAELEVLEMSKHLIPVSEVSKEIFEINRNVRDAFLNVIPRTAAILAAQSDPNKVREMMEKEFRHALEGLSNSFEVKSK